ncbi:uncharacterized mitochondrial protein AtMg00810-like [Tripterygium wilfordii]|uniref:uncharacterized mitochondrial protein AtMg00810-like n=1 Tax=Tripterygium wilfordii TaxID=458696 RepID=UPI0018F7FC4D|nr:uncharacterized mitochondrial protein AtMg00810-like [Tripterygium wilfordii]
MKDLGDLHYFLGIQATSTSAGLFLCQQKYLFDHLHRFSLSSTNVVKTPSVSKTSSSIMDGDLLADPSTYRSMVGALQYLTMTRPDIAHSVHVVSQFMNAPRTAHLQPVKRIFHYLKGTQRYGLYLRVSSDCSLTVYTNADWAGCRDSCRSTTGYAVFLGPNLISWRAKKQPIVSRSSIEFEYRAVAYAVAESVWLRQLLKDFGVFVPHPFKILCDNVSAIYLTANPILHKRTKHIDVDILMLIIILFENGFCVAISLFYLFRLNINLKISLPKASPPHVFSFFATICPWFPYVQIEGAY